jgi:hypothetical protein
VLTKAEGYDRSQLDPKQKSRSNRAGRCALAIYRANIGLGIESPFIAVEQDLASRAQRVPISNIV